MAKTEMVKDGRIRQVETDSILKALKDGWTFRVKKGGNT